MAEKELPTPEEMQEMAEIDIRTVDTRDRKSVV